MMQDNFRTNLLKFDSLHEFHKGKCGYCDNKLSTNEKSWMTAGFVCRKMGLEVYQSLMDKGWRRCGTYYYRADVDKCCCRPYSIRLDVLKFAIRPSQKKALKKFDKFLNPSEKNKDEKPNEKNISKEKTKKEQKIEIENPEEKEFLEFLDVVLRKELTEYVLGIAKEMKKMLNIEAEEKKFVLTEEMMKNIKFLKASSKKFDKNHFLTNFFMVYFAKNKESLGVGKMKIEEFMEKEQSIITDFITQFLQKHKYKNFLIKHQIQPNGYIFFELCTAEDNQSKNQKAKKMEIEEEKYSEKTQQKPLKPLKDDSKMEQEKNPEKIPKKHQDKIEEEKKSDNKNKLDLEVRIEKAKFEKESFELYKKYCKEIHQKDKESESGYASFLCEQALEYETFKSGNEELMCGCYHMKYYLKGKLLAVGVVDILPTCLSSVYFFYDPDATYKKLGLGVVSSLKEIEWIQKKQLKFVDFKYYYLGFFIQNCQKMVYKGDYEPSELLCPITYNWVTLDENVRNLILTNQTSSQIAPKESKIIDEMKFKDDDEILKIIDKKIKLSVNNRNLAIKDLRDPYDKVFRNIFKVLMKLWGKKVVDYLYFGESK